MARKTKEEALETRHRLLDTAEEVFHQKGVSRTTLNDIANAAGMTRGAIYWHFKNKVDLFNAMCDRITLPLESMTEASASDTVEDPLGELRQTAYYLFAEVVRNRHTQRVMDILFNKCELVADLGPIVDRDIRVHQAFRQRFERTFKNAEQRGQLPKGFNHRIAVIGYQALIKGLLTQWLQQPTSFDLEKEGKRIVDSYFEMLQIGSTLIDTN